jgi:hypothetical protein
MPMKQLISVEASKFHVAHASAQRIVNKTFWKVKVGDVDRTRGFHCANVLGS